MGHGRHAFRVRINSWSRSMATDAITPTPHGPDGMSPFTLAHPLAHPVWTHRDTTGNRSNVLAFLAHATEETGCIIGQNVNERLHQ